MSKWGFSCYSAGKNSNVPVRQRGFVLISVVVAITLLAAIAFMLSYQGASESSITSGELERDQLRYIAEAGLAHAQMQLADNSSCGGYTDIAKTDFAGESYSVSFVSTEDSPVTVESTALPDTGAGLTLRSEDLRAYEPPNELTMQFSDTVGKDSLIDDFYPNANWGSLQDLIVRSNPSWVQRPLLEFDVSALPAGVHIVSAKLELAMTSINVPGVIGVHRMTRSWVEGTGKGTGNANGATWNEYDGNNPWALPGGEFDAALYAATSVSSAKSGGWVSWEIRDLVDDWVSGHFPNHGLILVGDGTVNNAQFASRDDTDPSLAPRLTITYACECGRVCAGTSPAGNVLLVVSDSANPTLQDQARQALIESFGFVVTVIDDGATQTDFDNAVAASDVAYVSEEVLTGTLGAKLRDAPIGVVIEEEKIHNEFGISSSEMTFTEDSIDIVDNTHYITSPLSLGQISIFGSLQPVGAPTGTLAPGLSILAHRPSSTTGMLDVIETGGALFDTGVAEGRRVKLPWGGNDFDINSLTADGKTIMRRAIEWGAHGPQENPVAHWKFDEGSGLTALDSEGGHDGTLLNGPAWVPGKLDTALDFDGSDDVVEAPQASDLDLSTFTVAAWIRLSSITPSQTILEKRNGADLATVNYLLLAAGNEITWAFYDGGWASFSTNAANMVVDTWYHVAGTYDNSSGEGNVYVDGVLLATGTTTKNPPLVPGSVRIGDSECSTCGDKWSGSLDDVRIYNRALGAAEIADLHAGGVPGPIAHWKLDDGTGLTAMDSVGGHDGTLVNGPLWAAGQDGGALDFDGANDEVDVPHSEQLSLSDAFTLTSWIKPGSISSGYQAILFKGNAGDFNWWFGLRNGELVLEFYAGGSLQIFTTSGAGLTAGNWYHIAASFDNAADTVALYIDGVHVHTQSTTATPDINSLDLLIGNSAYSGEEWDGLLDDVRIYDRMLGAAEIAAAGGGGVGGGVPGSGVLLVVGDTSALTIVDTDRIQRMEDWGYTITLIDDSDSASAFATEIAAADVLYIGASTNAGTVSGKVESHTIGIVSENGSMIDDLGFALSAGISNSTQMSVLDPSHYVMAGFGSSTVTLLNTTLSMTVPSSTLAPDLQQLARVSTSTLLLVVALEAGDLNVQGRSTPGRRIHLPLRSAAGADLATDGAELIRRAIVWGTGRDVNGSGYDGTFLDEFKTAGSYAGSDGTLAWATDWLEFNESDGASAGDEQVLDGPSGTVAQVQDNDSGGEGLQREANLSGYIQASLTFLAWRSGLDKASDYVTIDVSANGGISWTELGRIEGPGTDEVNSPLSMSFDISAFIGPNTRIRFLTSSGMGNTDLVYLDNVQIEVR